MKVNWLNMVENIVLIIVVMVCLGVYTKLILEPIMEKTIKTAIEKETTAITQTVSQEIDNKFKVYKGGEVNANVSPNPDLTQDNDLRTSNGGSHENCIQLSDFTETQQRRIKKWLE